MTSSKQHPIGSGYDAHSTAEDVVGGSDLTGKTAIITGGHSHLGLETARVLTGAGALVVIPARDPRRAQDALSVVPGATIEQMDLMDPQSIDAFSQRFIASGEKLDILVNSAGIMATPLARDAQGNESQFSTNHLGHFRLTCRLWPALRRADGARVVSLSSRGHQISDIDFGDINFDRRAYDKWVSYGQSKTANILFALALDGFGEAHGIRAFSVHPGSVLGPLARHLTEEEIDTFGARGADGRPNIDPDRDMKTPQQGAATSVWCATSGRLDGLGGVYCENSDVAPMLTEGAVGKPGVAAWAVDPSSADRLWTVSRQLTGVDLAY